MTDYGNIELELLASLFNYPDQISDVNDIIGERKIFSPKNQKTYDTIIYLWSENQTVDVVSVSAKTEDHSVFDYATLGSSHAATTYAKILIEKSLGKELKSIGLMLSHTAGKKDPFEIIRETQQKVSELENGLIKKNFQSAGEIGISTIESIKNGFQGVPTGYIDIDNILGGWRNSSLIIIAARPSVGKTALALGSGIKLALSGIPVGMFSHEMASQELIIRAISSIAKIDGHALATGHINDRELEEVQRAVDKLAKIPFYIDDSSGLSFYTIRARARNLVKETGAKCIIIDYLQLVSGDKGGSREQEVSSISRGIKACAKELKIPIILLSQLSRKGEEAGREPILSDLRDSGAIEQDADVVLFLHGKEEKEAIIAKHRNGPTDRCKLAFVAKFASFENYDWRHNGD